MAATPRIDVRGAVLGMLVVSYWLSRGLLALSWAPGCLVGSWLSRGLLAVSWALGCLVGCWLCFVGSWLSRGLLAVSGGFLLMVAINLLTCAICCVLKKACPNIFSINVRPPLINQTPRNAENLFADRFRQNKILLLRPLD